MSALFKCYILLLLMNSYQHLTSLFKIAIIRSLLKKNTQMTFLLTITYYLWSEVLEKVSLTIVAPPQSYLVIFNQLLLIYHLSLNTDTTLFKSFKDLSVLKGVQISVLKYLDLSAAFDTVDHYILLHLQHIFGIYRFILFVILFRGYFFYVLNSLYEGLV